MEILKRSETSMRFKDIENIGIKEYNLTQGAVAGAVRDLRLAGEIVQAQRGVYRITEGEEYLNSLKEDLKGVFNQYSKLPYDIPNETRDKISVILDIIKEQL
ncbi:hypothetical protein PT168_08540 [Erysipelothrix rhusiopathiae]|nr:hypothetical protein [Erysipelothrix rhusiopathiae]